VFLHEEKEEEEQLSDVQETSDQDAAIQVLDLLIDLHVEKESLRMRNV
jgi:hypothetical protein